MKANDNNKKCIRYIIKAVLISLAALTIFVTLVIILYK